MICQNCSVEIPPAWVAAIASNQCPACSGPIMDDAAQALMEGLATALKQMPNNPQGIAGWILSNFQVRQIGDALPVDHFHGDRPPQEHQAQAANPNYPSSHQRYLGNKHEATKGIQATNAKLAHLAQSIQGNQNSMYGGEEEELNVTEDFDPSGPSKADIEAAAELMGTSLPRNREGQSSPPVKLKDLLASQAGALVNPNAKSLTSEEISQLEAIKDRGSNESDALMKERMKRVSAQKNFDMGTGSFRRSE